MRLRQGREGHVEGGYDPPRLSTGQIPGKRLHLRGSAEQEEPALEGRETERAAQPLERGDRRQRIRRLVERLSFPRDLRFRCGRVVGGRRALVEDGLEMRQRGPEIALIAEEPILGRGSSSDAVARVDGGPIRIGVHEMVTTGVTYPVPAGCVLWAPSTSTRTR